MTAASVLVVVGFLSVTYAGIIENLPGAPTVSFNQYAGYLNTSATHHMYYWFVESQHQPSNDPVIVWLTGGPGCSGLSALLTENGPFTVQDGGQKLVNNPYSWNKKANVLTLESPVGVGFSYTDDGNINTDDNLTAEDNWAALKAFFTEFPQYQNNDFYIAGESYGGIYAPTLADIVLKQQSVFKINLKGIAIGNSCVNESLNVNTQILYAYSHGMIDETTWERVNIECCGGKIYNCPFSDFTGWGFCAVFVQETIQNVWYSGIYPYDIYSNCFDDSTLKRLLKFPITRAKLDFIRKVKQRLSDSRATLCLDERRETIYLNRPEVRKALHVPDFVKPWAHCSDSVYDAYQQIYIEMDSHVKNAVNNGVRVLLYNGDTDLVCNFLQGQRFAASLGFPKTSSKTSFMVDGQIGGFHTQYGNVEFVSVRGAGHMVPTDKPSVSFHIIDAFLNSRNP